MIGLRKIKNPVNLYKTIAKLFILFIRKENSMENIRLMHLYSLNQPLLGCGLARQPECQEYCSNSWVGHVDSNYLLYNNSHFNIIKYDCRLIS